MNEKMDEKLKSFIKKKMEQRAANEFREKKLDQEMEKIKSVAAQGMDSTKSVSASKIKEIVNNLALKDEASFVFPYGVERSSVTTR